MINTWAMNTRTEYNADTCMHLTSHQRIFRSLPQAGHSKITAVGPELARDRDQTEDAAIVRDQRVRVLVRDDSSVASPCSLIPTDDLTSGGCAGVAVDGMATGGAPLTWSCAIPASGPQDAVVSNIRMIVGEPKPRR